MEAALLSYGKALSLDPDNPRYRRQRDLFSSDFTLVADWENLWRTDFRD